MCVCVDAVQGQTRVAPQTLNPVWDSEVFDFCVRNVANSEIRVEVWDWDRVGESDYLGHTVIPVGEMLRSAISLSPACWVSVDGRGTSLSLTEAAFPLANNSEAEILLGLAVQPPELLDSVESPSGLLSQWMARFQTQLALANASLVSAAATTDRGSEWREAVSLARAVIFLHHAFRDRFSREVFTSSGAADMVAELKTSLTAFLEVTRGCRRCRVFRLMRWLTDLFAECVW